MTVSSSAEWQKGRTINYTKSQYDVLQPETCHSPFSTTTFARSAGRSSQPPRQDHKRGVRAQVTLHPSTGGQERKRQRKEYRPSHQTRVAQHTRERVAAAAAAAAHGGCLGQPLTTSLGLSTNLSLTQTGPPLAQLWPSREYIHARSMSPPCQKIPEAPNGKKGMWFSTAQCHGSTLEDQPHRAKHTLGDSPRLTVTLWSSHSSLGGFSAEKLTRRGNAQLAYNVLPKS